MQDLMYFHLGCKRMRSNTGGFQTLEFSGPLIWVFPTLSCGSIETEISTGACMFYLCVAVYVIPGLPLSMIEFPLLHAFCTISLI